MGQHFFHNGDSIKVQYGYGLTQSGVLTFEVTTTDSPEHYRVILCKDNEVVYDREISLEEINNYIYINVPYTSDNLLNAGYIASLWNHRMLYLMYGDGDGTLYEAAVAICNAVVSKCYDFERLGFLP